MERLRQAVAKIGAQLSVLTISQRIAIGLCAALAAGSLLWLLQWSTSPQMVPLVTHDFSYEELDAAEQSLRANGIPYIIRGARVYVRPADRHNTLRLLHSDEALPEGSLFDMASVVTETNPFQSPSEREFAQNYAKGNELAKIIATSPAVRQASVIINPVTKRRLGGIADTPTASVAVTLAPGREMNTTMVEAFARLVAGAVAGLKAHQVNITDARTLRSYNVPHPDDVVSFDLLALIKEREAHFRDKILNKLADIPGVQVAVTVELDTSKRVTKNIKHDLPQPKLEMGNSTEQSSGTPGAEPGVQANLGTALTAGSGVQTGATEETTVENFPPMVTQQETVEQIPLATKQVSAAVGIPRSFIVGVFRAKYPDLTEGPADDDPKFVAVQDEQVARVRSSVERIVMAGDSSDVEIDVYPDMEWTTEGGTWNRTPGVVAVGPPEAEVRDTIGIVRAYGPQIGLGMLAVVSLAMMMRLVRKSSELVPARRRPGVESGEGDEEVPLTVSSGAVGRAEVSESMLTAKEVDPETLRYEELVHEVSEMVRSDPEGAASLIRRWIEDSH
jgi:flagellar M-ring protein FliF